MHNLGVITFSPPLESRLRRMEELKTGESWELQLRGCSIWAVEAIRQQIVRIHPDAEGKVNAVLLDFLLYDLAKEFESTGTLPACGVIPLQSSARKTSLCRPISGAEAGLHKQLKRKAEV